MHVAIRYLTEYRYDAPVTDNLNALRVKPATTPTQRVDDFVVRVDPEARLRQHADYFGTTVIEFGISRPHDHMSIDVRAREDDGAGGPGRGAVVGAGGCGLPGGGGGVPDRERRSRRSRARRAGGAVAGGEPARHRAHADRGDPGPVRVQAGGDVRRLDGV
jgi:hypothetical protein